MDNVSNKCNLLVIGFADEHILLQSLTPAELQIMHITAETLAESKYDTLSSGYVKTLIAMKDYDRVVWVINGTSRTMLDWCKTACKYCNQINVNFLIRIYTEHMHPLVCGCWPNRALVDFAAYNNSNKPFACMDYEDINILDMPSNTDVIYYIHNDNVADDGLWSARLLSIASQEGLMYIPISNIDVYLMGRI